MNRREVVRRHRSGFGLEMRFVCVIWLATDVLLQGNTRVAATSDHLLDTKYFSLHA